MEARSRVVASLDGLSEEAGAVAEALEGGASVLVT